MSESQLERLIAHARENQYDHSTIATLAKLLETSLETLWDTINTDLKPPDLSLTCLSYGCGSLRVRILGCTVYTCIRSTVLTEHREPILWKPTNRF